MIIKGKTQKGKNRIREWGSEWNILERKGDRIAIVSIKEQCNWSANSVRWIEKNNDQDFEIISC